MIDAGKGMDDEEQQQADWLRHGLGTGGANRLSTTIANLSGLDLMYMGSAQHGTGSTPR